MSATSEMILTEINQVKGEMQRALDRGENVTTFQQKLKQLNEKLAHANETLNENKVLKG